MWRHYLLGRKFLLKIDNIGLKYIFDQHNLNGRQEIILAFLSEYEFEIKPAKSVKGKGICKLVEELKGNDNDEDKIYNEETLIEEDKEKSLFFQCPPHWNVVALDSHGRSEGLLTGWNPYFIEFCVFGIYAGIFMEGRFCQIVKLSCIL